MKESNHKHGKYKIKKNKWTKDFFIKGQNTVHRQIDECQFWYNGASKRFVKMMHSIIAIKQLNFFFSNSTIAHRATMHLERYA